MKINNGEIEKISEFGYFSYIDTQNLILKLEIKTRTRYTKTDILKTRNFLQIALWNKKTDKEYYCGTRIPFEVRNMVSQSTGDGELRDWQ